MDRQMRTRGSDQGGSGGRPEGLLAAESRAAGSEEAVPEQGGGLFEGLALRDGAEGTTSREAQANPFWSERAQAEVRLRAARPEFLGNAEADLDQVVMAGSVGPVPRGPPRSILPLEEESSAQLRSSSAPLRSSTLAAGHLDRDQDRGDELREVERSQPLKDLTDWMRRPL